MHINLHPHPAPRPLSLRGPPYIIVPRQQQRGGLVEMTGSEFNSLSGNGGASMSVGTITTDASDWDTTTALNGLFQDGGDGVGYSNSSFSHPAQAPAFGGAYAALNSENSTPNAATRGFETQPQQQQQFSTQVLSYNTSKFIPRPPPPPPAPLSSLSEGFQVQQQANEYWNSLAASTTNQDSNWKMNYNDNPILADFTRQCAYDEFIPLPMQTGRLSSFSLGEDGQSPDTLHFSPIDEGQDGYGEKRWGGTMKCHGQNLPSYHGLPYTFFDDSSNANASAAGAFPPWTDTPGLDTVSPKALTLSSSSISFSGSSSSDCGSLDSHSRGVKAGVQPGGDSEA
ncbi:hypothetical protein V501_06133 [Pseudogymnoascus sp. VKM F-4519 (FW-2642)]|nr:hypothetical protein V501_06133 [Pseudogymnoascus sp. VKM F-4519 (FW-2642)]